MTTINEARVAIYQRFIDNWTATPDTNYTFDNEGYDSEDLAAPWVRVLVRNTAGGQETLGNEGSRKFERSGIILCLVHALENTGTESGDEIAKSFQSLFEAVRFNGIITNNSVIRETGKTGRWFVTTVEVDFLYHEQK